MHQGKAFAPGNNWFRYSRENQFIWVSQGIRSVSFSPALPGSNQDSMDGRHVVILAEVGCQYPEENDCFLRLFYATACETGQFQ